MPPGTPLPKRQLSCQTTSLQTANAGGKIAAPEPIRATLECPVLGYALR